MPRLLLIVAGRILRRARASRPISRPHQAFGVYAMTAVTAITVQDTRASMACSRRR